MIYSFKTYVEAKKLYGSVAKYRAILKLQEEARRDYRETIQKLKRAAHKDGDSNDSNSLGWLWRGDDSN